MMSKAELKKPFCVQSGLEQEEETVLTSHVTNDIHSNRLSQKGTFFLYHESVKIAIKIIFPYNSFCCQSPTFFQNIPDANQ